MISKEQRQYAQDLLLFWPKTTYKEVARQVGISDTSVARIHKEMKAAAKRAEKVTVKFDKPATKHTEKQVVEALFEFIKTTGEWINFVDSVASDAKEQARDLDAILTAAVNKTTDINTRLVEVEKERILQKWFNLLVAILASTALVMSLVR